MTWCCDSAKGTRWFRGLILVPYPSPVEISIDEPQFRWMREHGTLHIPDVRAQNDFPKLGSRSDSRTFLAVPLRQQGELIGGLIARRIEVRPFTPAQIKLLETFADQAVIAIENVRLFQELKESLEQQTATSEILGVIASSPTDIQPVLDAVAENAARLCDANDAVILRVDGDRLGASVARYRSDQPSRWKSRSTLNRGVCRRPSDCRPSRRFMSMTSLSEVEAEFPDARDFSEVVMSDRLATPLLREGIADRGDSYSPYGGSSLLGETNRASENLRRPSGDRHRERPACSRNSGAQRGIARGAGASDGNVRGARHHQPLADRRAAGARRHRRERGPGLWNR